MKLRDCLILLFAVLAAPTVRAAGDPDALRIGIYSLPPQSIAPFRSYSTPSIYFASALYDALTEIAPGGVAVPALAIKWEQRSATTWRFHLRANVKFSNGEVFDASAIAFAFGHLLKPENRGLPAANLVANIAGIAVVDPLTVDITAKRSAVTLPNDVAGIYIPAPRAYQSMSETDFARAPIGTGPYRIAAKDASTVTMEAAVESWRSAKTKRLRFQMIADESARVAALQTAAIDVVMPVSPDAFDVVTAAGARILEVPSASVFAIQLITERTGSPFKDVRVRRAVNYAINKDAIAKALFAGRTSTSGQAASGVTAGFDRAIPAYPYDPAKAKALLAEAGFPKGFKVQFDVVTSAIPADAAMFTLVARDLAAVGVVTEIQATNLGAWAKKHTDNSFEGLGFQMGFISQPQMNTVRAMMPFLCRSPAFPVYTCLPELEPLVDAAENATTPDRRMELERALNRAASEQALAIFLIDGIDFTALSKDVTDAYAPTRFYHWERFAKRR